MYKRQASANVETRGESVFAARNAIDGVKANRSHGAWPFESWGINRQDDAQLTLESVSYTHLERATGKFRIAIFFNRCHNDKMLPGAV